MRGHSQMSNNKISELRPGASAPEAPEAPVERKPGKRRRSPRRSKKSRSDGTVQRLQIAIAVLVALLLVAALSAVMSIRPILAERDELVQEGHRLSRDLRLALEEIESLQQERGELVAARIPGLEALVFDETIEVGERYVRNVLFTLTVVEGKPAYEYRVVFSNEDLVDIIPNFGLVLFSELGVQLGAANINADTLTSQEGPLKLMSGDVRSFSGKFELSEAGEPKFYLLQVK